jgi:hypothetical protein
LDAARAAHSEAEKAVRGAGDETSTEAARFEVRARDRLSSAERRAAEAHEAAFDLDRRAQGADAEGQELEQEARRLAEELRGRPRLAQDAGADPAPGLGGIAEWGSAAGAALFVARGQLAAEREGVIRQANELGSLALGEPLTALGASVVARRVQREFKK